MAESKIKFEDALRVMPFEQINLNNITRTGIYTVATNRGTPTTGNYYGILIVCKGSFNYVTQILVSVVGDVTYTRGSSSNGNTWEAWKAL